MLQETRRILHNDQGINPRRRYNNYKYICTQCSSTTIHNANANSIKEEIDSDTVILGDFNTTLIPMDRSSRQNINKEKHTLNDIIDQIDIIDIYRTFHPKPADYPFFSRAD